MKIKLISHISWMFFFGFILCSAQPDVPGQSPESISGFTGIQFHSRTLKGRQKEETVQQWVLPLFAAGLVTEDLSIRIYQTVSTAKLEQGPSLSGLENTKVRGSLRLFEDALITYLGLSLPIAGVDPKKETAHLSNLLYREPLQFGVSRIAEGFDLDVGFAFAHPFGNLSLGFGAGYISRGSYDRLSESGGLVSYNPGDALSATIGCHFRTGPMSLRGSILYMYHWADSIGEDNVFKNGGELSILASARFRLEPLVLTIFLADTMKSESDALQEWITVNNLFNNRLGGGISLAYPLMNEALILKAQARMRGFFDDGNTSAKVASLDGGFQLILSDNLKLDVLASLTNGDMDAGETDISGFSLGLIASYGL